MFQKHILIVLTCIGLLGTVGCVRPQVKKLAVEVHLAIEEKQATDQEVYDLVAKLAEKNLNSILEDGKHRLEKDYWEMQFRIVEVAHEAWLGEYKSEIEDMNDSFNTQIVEAKKKSDELYDETPDWPEEPNVEVPGTPEKWGREFKYLSGMHEGEVEVYEAQLDLLEKKHQFASGYKRIAKETLEARKAAVAQLVKLNEDAYSLARSELEQMGANVRQTNAQLQEALDQAAKMDEDIAEGSLALRDYLLRKSEMALFIGGLLKGLGLSPDIGKAETAIDKMANSLREKLNGTLNKYVSKMSAELEDNAKNGTNP